MYYGPSPTQMRVDERRFPEFGSIVMAETLDDLICVVEEW